MESNLLGARKILRPTLTELVLVASLSALYVVFRVVPTFPMFIVPGASFRAGDIVAPFYGIILGPFLGPLAIVFGTFAGFFLGAPPIFLGLDFLPASSCAGIVGLITRRRRRGALFLNLTLLVVFLLLPFAPTFIKVGSYLVPYVWLHLVGLAVLVSPLSRRAALKISEDWTSYHGASKRYFRDHFIGVLVLATVGTLAQHISGGILTQVVVGLNFHQVPGRGSFQTWQDFWTFIFWLYPGERTLIVVGAAALSAPVLIVLKMSRLTQHLPQM